MATYKVPQDVEADDKLIGPFTFRQFIYLLIMFGLIAVGFLFVRIHIWPLCLILVPPFVLLGALALPIRKDQPMETYLSAVVSFYLKPRKRTWETGQPNSTITISAPKIIEEKRIKDLTQEEASKRLSFLADIIDTEGYAIKGSTPNTALREEMYAEATMTQDIFENSRSQDLGQAIQTNDEQRHQQLVNQMRTAIDNLNQEKSNNATVGHFNNAQNQAQSVTRAPQPIQQQMPQLAPQLAQPTPQPQFFPQPTAEQTPAQTPTPEQSRNQFNESQFIQQQQFQAPTLPQQPNYEANYYDSPQNYSQATPEAQAFNQNIYNSPTIIQPTPTSEPAQIDTEISQLQSDNPFELAAAKANSSDFEENEPSQDMINLANNTDFSIETIAKQANRVNAKKNNNGEVYISLH